MPATAKPGLRFAGSQPVAKPAGGFAAVNKELWLILSIFLIAALMNSVVASQQLVLGLYMLPTLFSAYSYGRRHAVMTATCSILLVVLLFYFHPLPKSFGQMAFERWMDLAAWGGILIVTAYAMGTLYDRVKRNVEDLRLSYEGMSALLQQVVTNSKLAQDNRMALCATKIAEGMGMRFGTIEEIRAAALLFDMEKSGMSEDVLFKAAGVRLKDAGQMEKLLREGRREGGNTLRRALPILIAFSSAVNGSTAPIPIESQILLLAHEYEAMTAAGPKRVSPTQAIDALSISKRFDSKVIEAFRGVFS